MVKKYRCVAITLFLMIYSLLIHGQSNYDIGINVSTRLSGHIHPNYQPDHRYAFWLNGVGVSIRKSLSDKLYLQTGLDYLLASSGFEHVDDWRYTYDTEGELFDIVKVGTMEVTEQYRYLSLPLLAQYAVANMGNTKVFLSGGVLFDWLFQRKNFYETTFDGKREESFAKGFDVSKINSIIRLSFGMEKPIGERFSVLLSPAINYEMMNAVETRENFTSAGLNLYLLVNK